MAVLPAASDAEKVTVVSPREKVSGASFVTDTDPSTSSVAVAPPNKAAIPSLLAGVPAASTAAKTAALGAVTVGATVSGAGTGVPPPDPPPQAARKKVTATT